MWWAIGSNPRNVILILNVFLEFVSLNYMFLLHLSDNFPYFPSQQEMSVFTCREGLTLLYRLSWVLSLRMQSPTNVNEKWLVLSQNTSLCVRLLLFFVSILGCVEGQKHLFLRRWTIHFFLRHLVEAMFCSLHFELEAKGTLINYLN